MTHKLDADDLFIHCIQQRCAEARLNFFLIEPAWVELFFTYLQQGKIWPRALLNMHSEHHQPEDIFHRLVKLAAERQTQVIDQPDRAQAAFDKSRLHPRLVDAGIPVPWTLVVPRDQPEGWRLTEEQRAALGMPFVIKPAMGYGRKGLVLDATQESDLARSISAWSDRNYLFQRRIVPQERNGEPFYLRAYHVFGSVYLTWWNCFNDRYRLTTDTERQELGLQRVEELVRRLAVLTGMHFFSSEIARTDHEEFVLIDYVNDQCHLLSQSAQPEKGVPDTLVVEIASRIVESVAAMVRPPGKSP